MNSGGESHAKASIPTNKPAIKSPIVLQGSGAATQAIAAGAIKTPPRMAKAFRRRLRHAARPSRKRVSAERPACLRSDVIRITAPSSVGVAVCSSSARIADVEAVRHGDSNGGARALNRADFRAESRTAHRSRPLQTARFRCPLSPDFHRAGVDRKAIAAMEPPPRTVRRTARTPRRGWGQIVRRRTRIQRSICSAPIDPTRLTLFWSRDQTERSTPSRTVLEYSCERVRGRRCFSR